MDALATQPDAAAGAAFTLAVAASPADRPAPAATFTEMRLRVGDQIPIEPFRPMAGGRAIVKVLGWLEGASLLATMPQNAAGAVALQEGEPVLMRAFTGRTAFAFRSRVLRMSYRPFPYLHLGFPEKIDRAQIRNTLRYRVNLPAIIAAGGKQGRPASIINIGTNGALIETIEPLDGDAGPLRISVSFTLHGAPVSLDLHAQVRGDKSEAHGGARTRHQYGVEFKELQPKDRLVLGSLLWYQINEHREHAA